MDGASDPDNCRLGGSDSGEGSGNCCNWGRGRGRGRNRGGGRDRCNGDRGRDNRGYRGRGRCNHRGRRRESRSWGSGGWSSGGWGWRPGGSRRDAALQLAGGGWQEPCVRLLPLPAPGDCMLTKPRVYFECCLSSAGSWYKL